MVDTICDYFQRVDKLPVTPQVQPGYLRPLLPKEAPEHPARFEDIMEDVQAQLLPGVTHWSSPRFFAFFPANTSFPGILAEMLISSLNMIGFSWAASPVSTELEMVMMDWLARMAGLPQKFLSTSGQGGGVIQGTASEAILVAMLAARAKAMEGRPPEDVLRLVAYSSDQAHSSYQKACMIMNVRETRLIPTTADGEWAMQPADLEAAIHADKQRGLIPFFLSATIGTTSTCAVDPVQQLADLASRHQMWTHVDAAYAGSFSICPEMRERYFQGVENVDSFSFNPHKSLLTTFDCCALWVGDQRPLKAALSLTPSFLRSTSGNSLDYKDWQIPLGRRFRALKLYFVLRSYGVEQLQRYLRHHLAMAAQFASWVAANGRFELAAPPRFGLVCFRLAGMSDEANAELLRRINDGGHVFLTHTSLGGRYTIRMAIGGSFTQLVHVQDAWQRVQDCARQMLQEDN